MLYNILSIFWEEMESWVFEWLSSGYLVKVLFLVTELVLLSYLFAIYRKHKGIGNWRPIFAGVSLLIQGTLINLVAGTYLPVSLANQTFPYFHLIGFVLIVWGFLHMISKLFVISHIDFLTKTYTKRYIERALVEALELHREENQHFSLIFIDLDNFKTINDEFGHEKGDELLGKVANVIKGNIRSKDCVGRYGGDEFMLLLQNSRYEEAEEIMARCKQAIIEDEELNPFGIEISGGIATYPQDAKNIQNLSMIADKRMYEDKEKNKSIKNCLA